MTSENPSPTSHAHSPSRAVSAEAASPSRSPGRAEPIDITFVCRANVSRSPMAERIMRHRLRQLLGSDAGWVLRSAGTHVPSSASTHTDARRALADMGVPPGREARSRQLSAEMIEASSLLLTSTRAERAWIVREVPTAARKTFTLRQFARLCAAGRGAGPTAVPQTLEDLVALAQRGRTRVQPVAEELDAIDDPTGEGIGAYKECAARIGACVDQILGYTEPVDVI